ncbi:MAG TPA: 3'-5' exonuclease, partial [Wenzhouxiangella sp.]
HGITPADVEGQPTIDVVLPLFHRFCEETVLVAHNADFDMTCINLKAPFIGKTFDYPVLDTLLLSALVHPNQPSHSLDEIAARLGIEVIGRHTALGDALVTAEILIKLLPLLKASGIVTLGDALNATQALRQTRARY